MEGSPCWGLGPSPVGAARAGTGAFPAGCGTLGDEKAKDGVTLPRLSSAILERGIEAVYTWGGPAR